MIRVFCARYAMAYACVWHDSFTRVTWLIYVCDMTHLCVWHDSFIYVTKLIYMWERTCFTGWRRLVGSPKLQINFHKRATKYRSLLRKMTYKDKESYESSYMWRNSFTCGTTCKVLLIYMWDHMWRATPRPLCDETPLDIKSYVRGVAPYVTKLIYMWDHMWRGVAPLAYVLQVVCDMTHNVFHVLIMIRTLYSLR